MWCIVYEIYASEEVDMSMIDDAIDDGVMEMFLEERWKEWCKEWKRVGNCLNKYHCERPSFGCWQCRQAVLCL